MLHLDGKLLGREGIQVVFWFVCQCLIRVLIFHHVFCSLCRLLQDFDGVWGVCDSYVDDVVEFRVPSHAVYHKFYLVLFVLDAGLMYLYQFHV